MASAVRRGDGSSAPPPRRRNSRRVEPSPILPSEFKVMMVFAVALVGVCTLMTLLAFEGAFSRLPSLAVGTIKGVSIALGVITTLSLLTIIPWYRLEKKAREKAAAKYALSRRRDPPPPPEVQLAWRKAGEPLVPPKPLPEPVSMIQTLKDTKPATKTTREGKSRKLPFFDLSKIEPQEDHGEEDQMRAFFEMMNSYPRETTYKMKGLPYLGATSEKGGSNGEMQGPLFATKLPAQQLANFPSRLKKWLTEGDKQECHFVVLQKPTNARGYVNLFMEPMVFDSANELKQQRLIKMAISSESHGIVNLSDSEPDRAIPIDKSRSFSLTIEKKHSDQARLGSDCRIYLARKDPISSIYLGAEVEGRKIGLHLIIINDENHPKAKQLKNAIGKKKAQWFLNKVGQDVPWAQDIQKTFSDPEGAT